MPDRRVPAPRRRSWALVVVGIGLLAVAGPLAGSADAHATLVASAPANDEVVESAPTEVVLTFDDGVTADDDSVTVVDPQGDRVEAGSPRSSRDGTVLTESVDDGPDGTYTVSFRVLSDDGHVIGGSYVYHVGRRTGAADVDGSAPGAALTTGLEVLGRWISFTGALLVGGVLAMALFVDRDRDGGWTGGLTSSRRLLLPGAVATLFGTGLVLMASAAELSGRSPLSGIGRVPDFVTSGRPGAVAGLRLVVALVLLVAVAGAPLLRRVPVLAAVAILATLALPTLGGHASTASPLALSLSSDVGHVLAAAAWVGGLGVLALTWDGSRVRAAGFSRMALVAAPLTIATGLLNVWLQERSIDAVTGTDHGRLALAKLFGAVVMVVFGLVHRRWLADAAQTIAGMARSIRVEALIGLSVVALTAVLVATPPGREATSEPVQLVRQAGDTTVRMEVVPARSGPNEVHLYYLSRDGSLASVDAAELEVSSRGIEPRRVELTPITASHATASGVQLTSGTWKFQLTIVTRGVPASTTFEVPIR